MFKLPLQHVIRRTTVGLMGKNMNCFNGSITENTTDRVEFWCSEATNPICDKFSVRRFHHVEFWCSDATNTSHRFSWALGMPVIAKSDLSTGNTTHASYLLGSGQLLFLFTAAYPASISTATTTSASIPTFSHAACCAFTASHGLAVRAIAIEVEDAAIAYRVSVSHGAKPSSPPITLGEPENAIVLAEIQLYNDVVLRYISYTNPNNVTTSTTFLPGFETIKTNPLSHYPYSGISGLDHVAINVPELASAVNYLKSFTGFHEFAEFTADEVGTTESGLNSVILACNNEAVILGINEPVNGRKRSQIQTFLDHNEGSGVQHLAVESVDIFGTLRGMKGRSGAGGFEFMPPPPPTYYRNLKKRAGDVLTDEQMEACEELGVLVDRDHEGTLLQVFTKPLGDRPTIFIEIIQRIGCKLAHDSIKMHQKPGCGGFGKGNIAELYKSVEEYEKTFERHVITS